MSLLNLTTETMVHLSERWVDPKKDRKQLTALPLIAPLLPVLQAAHEALLAKQRTGSAITAQIARNREEALTRDQRHDRKIRGTLSVLTGFAELSDDPELARKLLDLRDRLSPIGITAITRSYVDQAGDAQRLPSRLDAASKKLLGKLPAADGPLQAHVDAWLEEAREMGRLEHERDQLAKQLQAGDDGPTAAEVVQARNAWIRAARALEANLALDPKADDSVIKDILGPMRRAEAKADRRRGGKAGDGAGEDAGPAEPPGPQPSGPEAEETLDVEPDGGGGKPGAPSAGSAIPAPSHKPS